LYITHGPTVGSLKKEDTVSVTKVLLTRSGLADTKSTLENLRKKQRLLSDDGSLVPARSRTCPGKMTGDADETRRQSLIIARQIEELESVLRNCILLPPPTVAEYVGIGVIVMFQRYDSVTKEPLGREETYEIGGYRSTDLRGNLPRISYDSPLASAMHGLEVGEYTADITLKSKDIYLKVLHIELPGRTGQDDEPELALPNSILHTQ
jgi:transcription elongation GreA/GreB family factor